MRDRESISHGTFGVANIVQSVVVQEKEEDSMGQLAREMQVEVSVQRENITNMENKDREGVCAPFNFSWVVRDELAAMACPRMPSNIRFLEKESVKFLVTLSPEKRPPVHTFPDLKWTEIPIQEFCSPSVSQIKAFIDVCQECKTKKEAVGVHCRMGRGRTGVMAACFLVHFYGQSPETAVTNVRLMRPGSVETYEQEKAVVKYYGYLQSI